MTKLVLVTGANGYIASRLIPRLLDRGHAVRALARRPHLLRPRTWSGKIEIARGDVMDPASLAAALKDVHTTYYLIHNMASGYGYAALEIQGARNFAHAAADAGVEHIIYLGGLADPQQQLAPHMRSRIETGVTLRQGSIPVTEFRAGVIAGSGSISFEMIRFMTEFFPLIPGPRGLKNKTQPISIQNVVDYLLAALDNPNGRGRVFEIGGPQVATYREIMSIYAKARGLKRRFLILPFIPNWFMAFGIGLMSPVPYPIAYALVAGLSSDSVVLHNDAREIFPEVRPIDFDSGTGEALTRLHPLKIERVWEDSQTSAKILKHEGFFIDHRAVQVNAETEKIFQVICRMGGENDWPFANWLWRLRGWVNQILSPRRHEDTKAPNKESLVTSSLGGLVVSPGDRIDYYLVDFVEPGHLLLHSQLHAPGEGWMEWRVTSQNGGSTLTQTAYFAPRGFGGFVYWVLLYPLHAYVFRGMLRAIAKRAAGHA